MDPEIRPTDEWLTAVPETYCIEYGDHHLQNAEYIAQIEQAPPTVLHVGVDTLFNNMWGASERSMQYKGQLPPAALEKRAGDLRALVDAMHAAGVKTVMPYQSGMFYFGDHEKRTGLFDFYDHWERYAEFGIGPRPAEDPVKWTGRDRRPVEGFDYDIYDPCINHPAWRQLCRMTVGWVTRLGYDALFSDVNSHHCQSPSCQAAFRKYMTAKYSQADLQRLFGFATPEDIRMGDQGDGLLWVETCRHWGNSFAEFFAELTAAGRKHQPKFFMLPNTSSYANINEMYKRRRSGQNIPMWARSVPILMYEKMEQPGRIGRTCITDNFFQYKFAFANRTRAGALLYNSQEPYSIALSNAEAAALGGGSFIQGHYKHPEVRNAYRSFFESSADVLAGYAPHAEVAMVYFFDEMFWETTDHLEQMFCLKDYLCDHHVLWEYIVEKTFTAPNLAKYATVIVPGLEHISDEQVRLLREYAQAGGGVVLIGGAGRFTEEGSKRDELPFGRELLASARASAGATGARAQVRSAKVGKGWVVHAAKIEQLIQRPAFEVFQLTEDEANETATIIKMAAKAEARKRPHGADRLLAVCEKMAKRKLSVAAGEVPFTLRVVAYKRRDAEGRRMTVHLLNYDLPIHGQQKSGPPVPATDISLSVPLPAGWQPRQVRLRGPQAVLGATLPFKVKDGRLLITVPRVEIYELLDVTAE